MLYLRKIITSCCVKLVLEESRGAGGRGRGGRGPVRPLGFQSLASGQEVWKETWMGSKCCFHLSFLFYSPVGPAKQRGCLD